MIEDINGFLLTRGILNDTLHSRCPECGRKEFPWLTDAETILFMQVGRPRQPLCNACWLKKYGQE